MDGKIRRILVQDCRRSVSGGHHIGQGTGTGTEQGDIPQTVTEIDGKLPKDELKKRADEMTRRYIQFISDPHELEEAMIQEKESEIEAEKLLTELREVRLKAQRCCYQEEKADR